MTAPLSTNGSKPTWKDLTEAVNGLRREMQDGFDRLERRMRYVVTTLIAAGALAAAITALLLR